MRWEPMRELVAFRDSVNRLFDETSTRRFPVGWGEWKPSVDVVDKETEFAVHVDLPGYKPENIEVTVRENSISIRGAMKEEKETKEGDYQIKERSYGSFSRVIPLSAPIKTDQAKAAFKNGVLALVLPKVEVPKGQVVKIESE